MNSRLLLTFSFCLLIFSISNAQLRKDLEANFSKTGPVLNSDTTLSNSLFQTSVTQSISLVNHSSKGSFSDRFSSEWTLPPTFKYINSGSYNSTLALNPEDNFAQVVGKLGMFYAWNKIFKN